jgi:adenylate kinase
MVNLDVPDEIIIARISDRCVHLPSGRVYNMSYNKPKVPGFDDITGEPLTKRPDDNPVSGTAQPRPYDFLPIASSQETFALRLNKFYEATAPLLDYYASQPSTGTKLITLKGSTSDEIWPQLDAVIRQTFPSLPERTEPKKRHSLADAILSEEKQERTDPSLPLP